MTKRIEASPGLRVSRVGETIEETISTQPDEVNIRVFGNIATNVFLSIFLYFANNTNCINKIERFDGKHEKMLIYFVVCLFHFELC